jgi:probable F420-dependent oxidoreductase
VATGIVPLGRYATADIAALTRSAGPRFVLGLGGPQQAHPLGVLNGYLDELDAAGVGPADRLLAALGPRKLDIAARRAAGAITLLTTPGYTADARRALGPDPLLAVHDYTVLSTDAGPARAAIRQHAGFLAGVGGYHANLLRMGFTEAGISALVDELIDAVAGWGTADRIAERIRAHRDAGADHVNLSVLDADGPDALVAAARELATALGLS